MTQKVLKQYDKYIEIIFNCPIGIEKVLNYSVLESYRDKLQECAKIYRVFHLKKLK